MWNLLNAKFDQIQNTNNEGLDDIDARPTIPTGQAAGSEVDSTNRYGDPEEVTVAKKQCKKMMGPINNASTQITDAIEQIDLDEAPELRPTLAKLKNIYAST